MVTLCDVRLFHYLSLMVMRVWDMASNWLLLLAVWLADPNIDLGTPCMWYIMGSRDRWEFPPFLKCHWHSPCTALMAGIKAVQGDCETVSDSFGQQTDIEVHVIQISRLIMTYTASVKESSIIWKVPARDFLVMCHSPSLSTSSLSSARSLVSSPDTVITKPLNTGQVNWEKSASSPWTNLREMSLMV